MEVGIAMGLTIVVPLGNESEVLDYLHDHLPTTTMRTFESEGLLALEDRLGQEDQTSTLTSLHTTEMTQADEGTIAHHHEMIARRPGMTVDAAIAERIVALTGTVVP
jgi:hypothetical protein